MLTTQTEVLNHVSIIYVQWVKYYLSLNESLLWQDLPMHFISLLPLAISMQVLYNSAVKPVN